MSPDFIPNSFQTPNDYVDECLAFLTPEEWKVLSYFVRRIFGFNKHEDRVSISQLTDGIQKRNGDRLDYGTGLSAPTVRKAVEELCRFQILRQIEGNDPHKNEGALYALELDGTKVKLDLMYQRAEKQNEQAKTVMEKARASRKSATPETALTPSMPLQEVNVITPPPRNDITGPPRKAITGDPRNGISTQYPAQNPAQKPDQLKPPAHTKSPSPADILEELKSVIKMQFDQTDYSRMIKPLGFLGWEGSVLQIGTLSQPTQFFLANRARSTFEKALRVITGNAEAEIEFVLVEPEGASP